jgi:hypothetical protein
MRESFLYSVRHRIIDVLADPNNYIVSGLDEKITQDGRARLPHRVTFHAEDIKFGDHMGRNMALLILAHDFGLEPSLGSFNGFDKRKAQQFDADIKKWAEVGVDAKDAVDVPVSLEKEFHDSAKFAGNIVDTAKNFMVQNGENGSFHIFLNASQKTQLLVQASVLKAALNDTHAPRQTDGRSGDLLTALEQGRRVHSYDERPWHYNRVSYDASEAFPTIARHVMRNRLGVPRHQFNVLGDGENSYVMTMRADVLPRAFKALESSPAYEPLMRRGITARDLGRMPLLQTLFADVAAMGHELGDFCCGSRKSFDAFVKLLTACEAYGALQSLQSIKGPDPNNLSI